MIETRARPASAPSRRRGRGRRLLSVAGVLAVIAAGAAFYYSRPTEPASTAAHTVTASPAPSPSVVASPSPSVSTPPVLKLSGAVPAKGKGDFEYATGGSEVFGAKGRLRKYRVAVEKGSNEDADSFARVVDATLGDERSWVGRGDLRLQRVADADQADFTVFLATRETAGRMCMRGGVNITVGGRPYTSCRATGQAIINLDRWRLSAEPYLESKTPLFTYRHYVINHEVGHELGHRHEGCPKANGPAPVMVQQTLTLRGCKPYAWPRRNGKNLIGPAI